jgi:hypothetical protein
MFAGFQLRNLKPFLLRLLRDLLVKFNPMIKRTSIVSIFTVLALSATTAYAQSGEPSDKEKQKDKEETVKWITQKLNNYAITDYKMTTCDKPLDVYMKVVSNFTYDYSENSLTWSVDEVISDEPNIHKISTYKFYAKYFDDVSSDESVEAITFNKKCVKKRNNKMLHLSANGNVIEVTSFYYKKQYSNQFDKTTPKVKKMDINFKYDGEENLVARLGKAFKHLKQLVAPSSGAPDPKQDHKNEKF